MYFYRCVFFQGEKRKRIFILEALSAMEKVEKHDNFILKGQAYGGPIINVI